MAPAAASQAAQHAKVLLEQMDANLEKSLSTLKRAEHEQKLAWVAAFELGKQFCFLDTVQHCKRRSMGLLCLLQKLAAVDSLDQQFRRKWPLQPIFLVKPHAQRALNLDKHFIPSVLQGVFQAGESTVSTGSHATAPAATEEAVPEAAGKHVASAAAPAATAGDPSSHRAAEGANAQQAGSNGQQAGSNGQHAQDSGQQAGSSGQQAATNGQQTQDSGQQADSSMQQGRKKGEQTGRSRQRHNFSGQQSRNSGQQAEADGQQTGSSGQQWESDGQQAGPSSMAASMPTSADGAAVPMAATKQDSASPAVDAKKAAAKAAKKAAKKAVKKAAKCLTPYKVAEMAAREAALEGANASAVPTAMPTSGNSAQNGKAIAAIAPPQALVDTTVDGNVDSTVGDTVVLNSTVATAVEERSQLADDEATFRAVTGTACIAHGAVRYEAAMAEVLAQEAGHAQLVDRSVKLAVGIAAARAVVVAGMKVVFQDTEAVLEKIEGLVKLSQVNIHKAHNSTATAGKLALMVCIAALHLEQRAAYLFPEGRFREEQSEHLGSISRLQHVLCGLAEQLETALPTFAIPVGETAQAMLDGTARSGDLLPVTDWAVVCSSPAVSPAASPDVSHDVSPATSMPGSPVITSSATSSAARSGTPTAAPAALEAACQAAASPADSNIALPKPLSPAQPACSADSEDVDEHPEELDWLYGPAKPRQQASATKTSTQHEDHEDQDQAADFAESVISDVPVISADDGAPEVASSSSAQPATHAVVPQALLDLALHSGEVKNQPPQYQHILTSVYTRGVAKPKRRPDDKIPTCICQSNLAGAGFWSASAIGGVARRQSGRHLGMEAAAAVAAAAAASTVAASTACLPSKSSDVPHVDLEYTSDLGCEVTDLDVQQAMMSVDHFVSCLSMEEPEGSSLPVQQSLLPLIPFGTGWAGSLSQNKWHQKVAAQQQAGCGDQCLNRQLCTLCDAKLCPCGAECSNRSFEELKSPLVEAFLTPNRGWGVKAAQPIQDGCFVVEYVGEIISDEERERRMVVAKQAGEAHFYLMEVQAGRTIDGRHKSNIARLINTSCAPNCRTHKWTSAATGETRVGIFAQRNIAVDEELSYDYRFTHTGQTADAYRCVCGSRQCTGTLLHQPKRRKT